MGKEKLERLLTNLLWLGCYLCDLLSPIAAELGFESRRKINDTHASQHMRALETNLIKITFK